MGLKILDSNRLISPNRMGKFRFGTTHVGGYTLSTLADLSERVVKVCSLSPSIVNFSSLAAFRKSLNKSASEYILNISAFSVAHVSF